MLQAFMGKVFGTANDRELKKYTKKVKKINDLESKYEVLSDDELKEAFENLDSVSKQNIMRTLLRVGFFVLSLALLGGVEMDDDDEDSGESKIIKGLKRTIYTLATKWAGDIFIINSVIDLFENPSPTFSSTKSMIENKEFWSILPYSKAVENTAEFFSDEEED